MTNFEVLVVEDDVIAQMTLSQMLEDMGLKSVHIASNLEEAKTILQSKKVDLALLDVFLHGSRSGIEIAKLINEHYKFPVVYLTASHDSETFRMMNKTEHHGILEKPYIYDDIYDAVDAVHKKLAGSKSENDTSAYYHDLRNQVFNALTIGVCLLDEQQKIIRANDAFRDLLSTTHEELNDLEISRVFPQIGSKVILGSSLTYKHSWEQIVERGSDRKFISANISNYKSQGKIFHVISVKDITPLKSSLEKLENELEQNKILRAELQHRVKNSLNMVLGFLYMKEQLYKQSPVEKSFKKLQTRIQILARIHTLFFKEDFLQKIECQEFIDSLKVEAFNDYQDIECGYQISDPSFSFNNDVGIKLGLVINELISTAQESGLFKIRIKLEEVEGMINVTLFSEDHDYSFDIKDCEGQIGYQIIQQIGGLENIVRGSAEDQSLLKVRIANVNL
ncbi:MAG: response regulator [Bacteroidota bacterium]